MAGRTLELRFPAAGVGRGAGQESEARQRREAYPTPWSVNVRLTDPIARRLRGGSRPGLTKFLDDPVGTTIADIISVQTSSSSGTDEVLVVLVDSTLGVVSGGALTSPVAVLTDESGNNIVTEGDERIVLSTTNAPSAAFLIAGQQHAYAINSSAIVKLDPKTGLVTDLTATAGTIPTGSTTGAVYRDRLVLLGDDNTLYFSKLGDYTNWDFAVDSSDTGRAVPIQLSEASEVGDTATAIVAHADAFLLAATARGLWTLGGDPIAGGGLRNVSRHVGVVTKRAWCKMGPVLFFLAEDGLYQCGVDGSDLTNLSLGPLPNELQDIDTTTTTVLLGYDHDEYGIHLYLVTAGGSDTHWFFDLRAKAFCPMRLQDDHAPVAICEYGGDLLLGSSDGYIRSVGGDDDDGTAIESHVLIGPLRLGGPDMYGLIQMLHGLLAESSGTVNWRIVTGETADEAAANGKAAIEAFQAGSSYSSYVKDSGSWTAGRSLTSRPRVQAMWCCVWLQSVAKWGYESVNLTTIPGGNWR